LFPHFLFQKNTAASEPNDKVNTPRLELIWLDSTSRSFWKKWDSKIPAEASNRRNSLIVEIGMGFLCVIP